VAQATADFARGRGGAAAGIRGLIGDDVEAAVEEFWEFQAETQRMLRAGELTPDEVLERAAESQAMSAEIEALKAQDAIAMDAATSIRALREETEKLAESDPEGAARLFELRSDAILEVAQLEQEIAEETNAVKRQLLEDELAFIRLAQTQELAILQQELSTRQSTMLADLEAAQAAAVQLGNLIYYTQEDVGRIPNPEILQLAQSLVGQLGQFGGSITNYNYSPTYAGGAPAASQDFQTLRTLAG